MAIDPRRLPGVLEQQNPHSATTDPPSSMQAEDLFRAAVADLVRARLAPLHIPAAAEVVEDTMRPLLQLGLYAPGEFLEPERELSERLGISRMVLAAGLGRLQATGYIRTKRGKGGGSTAPETLPRPDLGIFRNPEPFRVLLEMRQANESLAARRAASLIADGDLELLSATIDPLDQAYVQLKEFQAPIDELRAEPEDVWSERRKSADAYHRMDSIFHLVIANASGDARLTDLIWSLRADWMAPFDVKQWPFGKEPPRNHHERILDALRKGDGDEAAEAMWTHIEQTRNSFEVFLKNLKARLEF